MTQQIATTVLVLALFAVILRDSWITNQRMFRAEAENTTLREENERLRRQIARSAVPL